MLKHSIQVASFVTVVVKRYGILRPVVEIIRKNNIISQRVTSSLLFTHKAIATQSASFEETVSKS